MISIVTLEEIEKWNHIVKSFKNYDIYYLSNYVKAFKIHGDGEQGVAAFDGSNFTYTAHAGGGETIRIIRL